MSQKTELQSNNTDLQNILSKVNGLPDQLVLPTLKNPAGAENIETGYQALSGAGEVIEGTATISKAPVRIVSKDKISWKGVLCAIDATKTYFVTVKIDSQWHACVVHGGVITDECDTTGFCSITDGNLISSLWSNAQFIVYEC